MYTNIWYGTQKNLLFPWLILLMCRDEKLSVLHMFNSKKVKLGMSPLYLFTKALEESNRQHYLVKYEAGIGVQEYKRKYNITYVDVAQMF